MTVSGPVKLEDVPTWRAHVLVAVEDPAVRALVERTLHADGHRVTALEDGVELLEALSDPVASRDCHLAIVELELSGFSGLEVLGLTDARRPPVLLLGEDVDLAMRRAARHFGAAAILGKRVDAAQLRLVAGALLRSAHRNAAIRRPL